MTLIPQLGEAARRLQIVDVTLKTISATLVDDFVPELSGEVDLLAVQTITPICKSINRYDGVEDDIHRRRSIFEMFAGLRLLRPHRDGHSNLGPEELSRLECAKVECYFLVSYDEISASGEYLDDDALSLFAQHNVPFNMWPYWREVVQSACSRMGLPRVVLPTHRLRKSATRDADPAGLQEKVG
jgi:hypothetical protein